MSSQRPVGEPCVGCESCSNRVSAHRVQKAQVAYMDNLLFILLELLVRGSWREQEGGGGLGDLLWLSKSSMWLPSFNLELQWLLMEVPEVEDEGRGDNVDQNSKNEVVGWLVMMVSWFYKDFPSDTHRVLIGVEVPTKNKSLHSNPTTQIR
ncbi:hypothetical protein E3N88_09290 [Mikania micrantha]|uniref:Uncharacterized protein n=1 Tax=Mikania micrantha TaxID=192012 RepID=A0A5N6PIP7_9ASTR|nr:hypothetical protein E3N88_09290 [Mikania micrantha]